MLRLSLMNFGGIVRFFAGSLACHCPIQQSTNFPIHLACSFCDHYFTVSFFGCVNIYFVTLGDLKDLKSIFAGISVACHYPGCAIASCPYIIGEVLPTASRAC